MAYVSQESICKTLLIDANKAIKLGEYESAESMYKQVLQRLEEAAGPVHPRIASVLLKLGEFYAKRNRFVDAEEQFRHAMTIYEKLSGDKSMDIAICLKHIAAVMTKQGRIAEATAMKERGRKILAARLGSFGMETVS